MMKRRLFLRPKSRRASWFLLLFFASFVIGLCTAGLLYYQHQQRRIKQDQWHALTSIAELKSNELAAWRKERIKDGYLLLNNSSIVNHIISLTKEPHSSRLRREAPEWMRSLYGNGEYSSIRLLDRHGNILASKPESAETHTPLVRTVLDEAAQSGKVVFSDFYEDPHGTAFLEIIVPVVTGERNSRSHLGSVVLGVDPRDFLYPLIQSWPVLSPTSENLLIRYEGDNAVYLNTLRHTKNIPLRFRVPINEGYLAAAMVARADEGILEGLDYRGVPVLAASRRIPNTPWFLVAKVDKDEVQEPIRRVAWFTAMMVGLLVVVTGLGIGLVWQNHVSGLEREKYQAELERKAVEAHFGYLAKHANDGILLMDENGTIVEMNDRVLAEYGYTRDELLRMNMRDIRAQEPRTQRDDGTSGMKQQGGYVCDTLHKRKDGSVFPVEESSRRIIIDGRDFLQSIIRDITDRKRTEQMLRESERRFSEMLRNVQLIAVMLDMRGNITFCNDYLLELTGWQRDQVVGKNWFDVFLPDDVREMVRGMYVEKAPKGELPVHFENEVITRRGTRRLISWNNTLLRDVRGDIVGSTSIGEDITDRKQSEEVLRVSEERFRALIEKSSDLTAIFDAKGIVEFVSPSVVQVLGYAPEELVGKYVLHFVHPDERKKALLFLRRIARQPGESRLVEFRIRHRDNSWRVLELLGRNLLNVPSVNGIVANARDITERKQAEEALRQSEEMSRLIAESAADLIAVVDLDGKRLYNSPSYKNVLADPDMLRGTDSFQEIHPGDRERVRRIFQETIKTGIGQRTEFRFLLSDGSVRYIESQGSVARDAEGKPMKVVIVSRDVTERTKAERQLRLLAQTIASARDCISITDLDDRVLFANEAFLHTYGFTEEEILGQSISMVRSPQVSSQVAQEILPATLDRGWHGEILNRRKDGTEFPVELWTSPVRDDTGRFVAMVGVARDITERKQVEAALRESEAKFRQLVEQAADGIFIADVDGKVLLANSKSCEMLGYAKEELLRLNISDTYAPNETDIALHRMAEIRSGEALQFERRMRRKNGTLFPVEVSLKMLGDGYSLGIVRDVTDRKRAEEALQQSEQRYRSLFENNLAGVYRITLDGEILDCNDSFARILGYDCAKDILRHKAYEFYFAERGREQFLARLIKSGSLQAHELCLKRRDGSSVYVVEDVTLVDTNILEGTIIDITERKRAEESERKLLRAVEQTDEVVFMTDVDGVITYVNPAFEKVYGYTEEEVIGNTPRLLKSGIMTQEFYNGFWKDILSGKSVRSEYVNKSKDGRLLILEASVSPIVDEDGAVAGFIAVQNDVTEQKSVEEKKKALEQQLFQIQKMESIGTLAGGIAHDFNNILAIISCYASVLHRHSSDPARFSESVDSIRKATDRGAGLVRQILTFARKTDVAFESLNVQDVIKDLVKMVAETFPKTITVDAHLNGEISEVNADRTQLHQALLNFCVNARDAMPDGGTLSISTDTVDGKRLRARFREADKEEYVCISVADTGFGMDEATRARIFEPFFTTKEKGKGTGLGLAVVYGIVRSHYGFVDVESATGRGTTFRLYLPKVATNGSALSAEQSSTGDSPGGTETILLVEDEEMLRELLRTLLEGKGYTVLLAIDGEDAVQIYAEQNGKIALVLSDLGLPKLNGWQAFRKMKNIQPAVKAIIASGYVEPATRSEMISSGVKDFVQKPYRPDQILAKIRDVIDDVARDHST